VRRIIVDTNVPIVANGRPDGTGGGPSLACRLAAIDFLEETLRARFILLDMDGEIQAQYRRYLNPHGQPGVGDRFYLEILMSMPNRVERLDLPFTDGAYDDFPDDQELAGFDLNDRVFAALARRAGAPVANATDSDWLHHLAALNRHGIEIKFVCGCDKDEWFSE
jgi:hypothetical protein